MDLSKMTDIEIKAAVYDQMVIAESAQKNIQALNQELRKRSKPKKVDEAPGKGE